MWTYALLHNWDLSWWGRAWLAGAGNTPNLTEHAATLRRFEWTGPGQIMVMSIPDPSFSALKDSKYPYDERKKEKRVIVMTFIKLGTVPLKGQV